MKDLKSVKAGLEKRAEMRVFHKRVADAIEARQQVYAIGNLPEIIQRGFAIAVEEWRLKNAPDEAVTPGLIEVHVNSIGALMAERCEEKAYTTISAWFSLIDPYYESRDITDYILENLHGIYESYQKLFNA